MGLLSLAKVATEEPVRSWDSTDGLTNFYREIVRLWSIAHLQKSLCELDFVDDSTGASFRSILLHSVLESAQCCESAF